ncbi:PROTEASE S28 PRO-X CARBOXYPEPTIDASE-RELATED [Salix viminalis]|uniref:PROTEASE S28 PRO-X CARBOXYPEPTIDASE-RELATED n=1 Tax=Salix viminalis TaxID=40686 RepID=A0A9Q0NZP9_SALVM|nr:PROTEASE S28 PRO-X CARBOXYPEPTIDASE-RELATED [Salix viminalis]
MPISHLTLDHYSPLDHHKFQQRYYEFLDYFRVPAGPIFLKICGESSCDGIANDYIGVLAKKFGAAVVSLEHRYYGKSLPFKSTTTENLRYLSSKQALFDLAVFRQYYQESLNLKLNRTGVENPWFVFGVSYSGALSAWFRLKFPHLTCGSLASSAVVLAVYNYSEFDQQIGESAGAECKAALQETTQLVEERLASNKKALEIDGDFLYFLADAAAIAFQYGNPDKLCPPLVQAKKDGEDLVEVYAKHIFKWHPQMIAFAPHKLIQDIIWIFVRRSLEKTFILRLTQLICIMGAQISQVQRSFLQMGLKIPWRHASKQISSPDMPSFVMSCHNCGHGTDMRGCPQSPFNIEGNAKNCGSPDAVEKVRHQIIEKMDLWLSECHASGRSSM